MNFDEGTLTKAGLAEIRKQIDSSIEGMISLRKVDLTMLLNMASKVAEVPRGLTELAQMIVQDCYKEIPRIGGFSDSEFDSNHAAQLIQAWHEAQLPVVTEDADALIIGIQACSKRSQAREVLAVRDAARDTKLREAWMPKPYWRDHVLCIGLQMLYEVRNVGGDLWVARDVDGGALFPPVSFDAARGQCETQAEAFIASLTAPVTEDGGEK